MTLESVIVTATFAKARPARIVSVMVMDPVAPPARMFPLTAEVEKVTPALGAQYTLHACPPPAMTTEKLVPARAAPIWKIQTALGLPRASRVNTPAPVNAP